MRFRKDYILGSDRQISQNAAVRDPRHNSNHFMVMGCLRGASPREQYCYLGSRTRLPLCPSVRQTRAQADKLFSELQRAVTKPDKHTARHNLWMSVETWRLADKRVSIQWEPGRDQRQIRRLGRAIRSFIKEDRRRRVTTAGEEVESLLNGTPPLPHEAWRRMQG